MEYIDENESSGAFDYSPWQRTEKRPTTMLQNCGIPRKPRVLHKMSTHKTSPAHTSSVVLPVLPSPSPSKDLFPDLRKECSTLCRHGARTQTPEVSMPEKRRSKDGKIALLKILIKERKWSLQGNKERYLKLLESNQRLKREIEEFEDANHNDVDSLLSKYKKYQGALTVLDNTHGSSLHEEETELKETQLKINGLLLVLRNECEALDKKIGKEKHALKVLHNYKEKEYPDKVEQMKHLQFNIDTIEREFATVMDELNAVAEIERKKYNDTAEQQQQDVISKLADTTLLSMDLSVKEMARQNVLLSQEIAYHKEELKRHQTEVCFLEDEIRLLKTKEQAKSALRQHPEQFLDRCLPDTEFELRIPKQRYLPL